MKIIDIREVDADNVEVSFDLTDEERKMIKKTKGWKRLTQKRLTEWFLETLENTETRKDETGE
jgi:hypothetical protein